MYVFAKSIIIALWPVVGMFVVTVWKNYMENDIILRVSLSMSLVAVLGEFLIRFHVYIEFSYPYLIMFVCNDQFQYDKPMVLHTS